MKRQGSEHFAPAKLVGRNKVKKGKKERRRHLRLGMMNKSRAQIIRAAARGQEDRGQLMGNLEDKQRDTTADGDA